MQQFPDGVEEGTREREGTRSWHGIRNGVKDGGPVRVRDVVPAHAIWRLSRHCIHVLPSPGLSIHFLSHYMYASLGGSHIGGGGTNKGSAIALIILVVLGGTRVWNMHGWCQTK